MSIDRIINLINGPIDDHGHFDRLLHIDQSYGGKFYASVKDRQGNVIVSTSFPREIGSAIHEVRALLVDKDNVPKDLLDDAVAQNIRLTKEVEQLKYELGKLKIVENHKF